MWNGITWNLPLCLASFPQHCNSEIHLHLWARGRDFFTALWYSIVCSYWIYLHFLEFLGVGTLHNGAVNILAHIFGGHRHAFLLLFHPAVELLGYKMFVKLVVTASFLKWLCQFTVLSHLCENFGYFTSSSLTIVSILSSSVLILCYINNYCLFSILSCVGLQQYDLTLHFSPRTNWVSFLLAIWLKLVVKCPLKSFVCFFIVLSTFSSSFIEVLYVFWYEALFR